MAAARAARGDPVTVLGPQGLRAQLTAPLLGSLERWAHELADATADTPLLGTGLRAARYPALLWNGARCTASLPAVAGLLCGDRDRSILQFAEAVAAGEAVTATARAALPTGPATGTVDALGCAVTVALLSRTGEERLDQVIDQAAALMVLGSAPAAGDPVDRTELIRAGHPVAAGWLACRAVDAGLSVPAGTAEATLGAIAGAAPSARPFASGTIGELCEALR